jgi:N-acyl homoserine lactone hydrolase
MADAPAGVTNVGKVQITMTRKLTDMMAELHLAPTDIEYLAVSHSHFDHVGNAGLFSASTWIVDAEEREWMFRPAARVSPGFNAYRELEGVRARVIDGVEDLDVFGDGSVIIIQAPGHTPGHTVLLLRLPDAGAVLLAGDLWNTIESRVARTGSAQEIASIDRVEKVIAANEARVIRQHVLEDFEALPRFPAALQ